MENIEENINDCDFYHLEELNNFKTPSANEVSQKLCTLSSKAGR